MKLIEFVGLRKQTNVILETDRLSFYKEFNKLVTESNVHFEIPIENLLDQRSKYIGEVNFDNFKIRRKSSLSRKWILPHITGKIEQIENSKINIQIEVNGFYYQYKIGLIIFLLGIMMLIKIFSNLTSSSHYSIIGIACVIFIIAFMQQYIRTRDLVQLDILDIERELSYTYNEIVKKKKTEL